MISSAPISFSVLQELFSYVESKQDLLKKLEQDIPKDLQDPIFSFKTDEIDRINEIFVNLFDSSSDHWNKIVAKIKRMSLDFPKNNQSSITQDPIFVSLLNFVFSYHYLHARRFEGEDGGIEHFVSFSLLYLQLKYEGTLPREALTILKTQSQDPFFDNPGHDWRIVRNFLSNQYRFYNASKTRKILDKCSIEPSENLATLLFLKDNKIIQLGKYSQLGGSS